MEFDLKKESCVTVTLVEVGIMMLAIAWLIARLFPARPRPRFGSVRQSSDSSYPFRAASIRCGGVRCKAAEAMRGERLLLNEVPSLPLVNCTSEKCSCVYVHHPDRRTGNMRSTFLADSPKQGFSNP